MHVSNTNTYIFIAIFAVGYTAFIAAKTARRQLDLYDLLMLSMVAVIPGLFVVFPQLSEWLSGVVGVEFPFVLMFGMLFAILFVFIHRLTTKIHQLELDSSLLVQELSLLKHAVAHADDKKNRDVQDGSIN